MDKEDVKKEYSVIKNELSGNTMDVIRGRELRYDITYMYLKYNKLVNKKKEADLHYEEQLNYHRERNRRGAIWRRKQSY